MEDQIVEAWQIHNRIQIYVLESLPDESLLCASQGRGTREEVTEQLHHFPKDQRFRLIALPELEGREEGGGPTLAERLAGRIGNFSFEPTDLSERTGEYYAKLLADKYAEEQKR